MQTPGESQEDQNDTLDMDGHKRADSRAAASLLPRAKEEGVCSLPHRSGCQGTPMLPHTFMPAVLSQVTGAMTSCGRTPQSPSRPR